MKRILKPTNNTQTENSKKEYFELRIPKLANLNYFTLFLVALLLILSFLTGSLYTKLRYLEQNGNGVLSNTSNKNIKNALVAYANELKLNTKKFSACLDEGKFKNRIDADINESKELEVNATPGFFINGIFLGGAYPYETFKEIIDKELAGTASEDYTVYSETLQQAYESPNGKGFDPVRKTIAVGDAAVRGDKNAKVTIVEYSDFQCPFCQRAIPTMEQILNDYKGQVRLVYKHLPLPSIHPNAQITAEASECAGEQNKFWEFHDVLFNKQQEWSPLPQA